MPPGEARDGEGNLERRLGRRPRARTVGDLRSSLALPECSLEVALVTEHGSLTAIEPHNLTTTYFWD